MLTVTWSEEEVSRDSQLLSVAYIVMVEVESHAEEAKILIWEVNHFGEELWEVNHFGEELLHHRLFENGQST